jgi:O-antigen ligase
MMFVSSFPSRFVGGLDMLPLVSGTLLYLGLNQNGGESRKPVIGKSNYKWFIVGAIGLAALALLTSIDNYRNLTFIPWVLYPIAAVFLSFKFSTSETFSWRHGVLYLAVGSIPFLLFELAGLFRGSFRSTDTFNAGRFLGSLGDYELSAQIYGISVLACFYILISGTTSFKLRILMLLVGMSFLFLLGSTGTRSAFILTTLGCLVLLSAAGVSKNVKNMITASAALLLGWFVVTAGFSTNFEGLFSRLTNLAFDQELSSIINRSGVWSYFQGIESFVNLPLLGNGFAYPYSEIQVYPHSLYLWLLWSGGVLGLALILMVIVAALLNAFSQLKTQRYDAISAIVFISYLAIDQIKIETARYSSSAWVFWAILALSYATFSSSSNAGEARSKR